MTVNIEAGSVPQWSIGDRLRKVRSETGMKQADFAAALGVNPNTYSAWETSRNTPSYDEVVSLAKRIRLLCGTPEWWLMGAENPHPGGPDGGIGAPSRTRTYDLRIKRSDTCESVVYAFPAPRKAA